MRTRILPPAEWPRVEHLPLAGFLPIADPENIAILVAEDEGGAIVGAWLLLRVTHLEGFWVDPAHAKKAGAVRALLRGAMDTARERGESWMYTMADTPSIDGYIRRIGGLPLPAQSYTVPVREF